MDNQPSRGILLLLASLVIGVIVCILVISKGETSPTEALLLSLFLTILSVIGSWVTSHYYAEYSSGKNLRMFALKAAEKVTNLSNEFDRLSAFLQQELETSDFESPAQALLAREMRIEGAIHIINTLKSVNDKSLSDWQGVIGDELIAQRERQEEREENLRELIDRVESLYRSRLLLPATNYEESADMLRAEVESIRGDLRVLASQVSGTPLRYRKVLPPLQAIQRQCPQCSSPVQYQQRPKPNSYKSLTCKQCGASLLSRFVDDDFTLQLRVPTMETVTCPSCSHILCVALDPTPGSGTNINCESCETDLRVYRTSTAIGVKAKDMPVPEEKPFDEALIERVKNALPPQPWPKGTAKEVAAKLGLSKHVVSEATNELIRRGVFKHQLDGELYVKEQE